MTRWRVVCGAAVVLTLIVGHLLRDTPGYMVRNADGSLSGDLTHYVFWTRLVTLGGIQAAYSGTWPETYAVYPPLTLLPFEAVGLVYQHLQDPSFDVDAAQNSLFLRAGIKFAAQVWHVLTGLAIFVLVGKMVSERSGAVAAALYLLNPAALYDVAHWGQPDGAHALFSVLSIGLLDLGQVVAGWASLAAAAMAKPQAWFLVPLIAIATLRSHGVLGLVRGVVAGGVVAFLISLPFVMTGRAQQLLTLPVEVSVVMPVVSADAHNLWWLVLQLRGQDPIFLQDSARAIGPLTYRILAGVLVAATMVLTCWLYWTRRAGLAEAAALGVLGWFTFTTQAHENHLFFALPLLSLAWPTRRTLLVPFVVISVSLLLNMVLHDQLVLEGVFGHEPDDALVTRLSIMNAVLNVACFAVWALMASLRSAQPVSWASRGHRRRRLGYSESGGLV